MSQPAEASTYAIGDVHGEVTLLRRLLDALPLRPEDTVVLLGDYLDRGEDSAATISLLWQLERQRRVVFLRGNHEDAWLDVWNGTTFRRVPNISGARKGWADFDGQPPAALGQWLETTRIDYEDEHGFYVHAGVLPNIPFASTPQLQKLGGAGNFLESDFDWGKPVVFGHWPLPEPLLRPNKIGIDTSAYKSGVLTAVRLPDRAIFQTRKSGGTTMRE